MTIECKEECPFVGRVFGLVVRSDFFLPEITQLGTQSVNWDVCVKSRKGKFNPPKAEDIEISMLPPRTAVIFGYCCAFVVTDGVLIECWESEGAVGESTRAFLLGKAFSVLLYQRQLWPMHVSAVGTASGVWMFGGRSGAGKSTLAMCLHSMGFSHLSDDKAVLRVESEGVRFYGGMRSVRLSRDAANFVTNNSPQILAEALSPIDDKVQMRLLHDPHSDGLTIRGLVVLAEQDSNAAPEMTRLRGIEAIKAVRECMYRPVSGAYLTTAQQTLLFCADFLREVPVFIFRRRRNLDEIGTELSPLIQVLRDS